MGWWPWSWRTLTAADLEDIRAIFAEEMERAMTAIEEVRTLIGQMNDATNQVAAKIHTLIERLDAGMTPSEVAEVKSALQAEVATLQAMGADPNNPIPA